MQLYFKESYFLPVIFFLVYYLKYVESECPPSDAKLQPLKNDLKEFYQPLKKLKPGTNPKDVDFVMYKVAKEIFSSKKWGPCNEAFDWNEIEKDAVMSRKECYHPTDLSKEPAQKEFRDCMGKLIPGMAMKYTSQSFEACECFSTKILPKYDPKYRKIIKQYFDEFKTLKHRKK